MHNMDSIKGKVIVFGEDGYNALGVVRSFGKLGISPFLLLVAKKKGCVFYSRYIKECKIVHDYEEGISFLENYFAIEAYPPVIITTGDLAASVVDKYYNRLKGRFILSNAAGTEGRLIRLMDKEGMVKLAEESGFTVPRTWHLAVGDYVDENITYPCIVKPLKSIEGIKQDIQVCWNQRELEIILSDSNHATKEFVVQQYIKTDYEMLLIGCRFLSDGSTVVPGLFKRSRCYPSPGGPSSFGLITTKVEKYIDISPIVNLVEKADYYGLFSIELGMSGNIPYFFEINYRNDGTSHYFDKAGINLPYLWVKDAMGEKTERSVLPPTTYYFIDEIGDFLNAVERRITFRQWLTDFRKAEVFMYYDKADRKPFFYVLPLRIVWVFYRVFMFLKNTRK